MKVAIGFLLFWDSLSQLDLYAMLLGPIGAVLSVQKMQQGKRYRFLTSRGLRCLSQTKRSKIEGVQSVFAVYSQQALPLMGPWPCVKIGQAPLRMPPIACAGCWSPRFWLHCCCLQLAPVTFVSCWLPAASISAQLRSPPLASHCLASKFVGAAHTSLFIVSNT